MKDNKPQLTFTQPTHFDVVFGLGGSQHPQLRGGCMGHRARRGRQRTKSASVRLRGAACSHTIIYITLTIVLDPLARTI